MPWLGDYERGGLANYLEPGAGREPETAVDLGDDVTGPAQQARKDDVDAGLGDLTAERAAGLAGEIAGGVDAVTADVHERAAVEMWRQPDVGLVTRGPPESFPTRSRTTGFGLVDGLGHLGGGIGVLVIAPFIPKLSVLTTFLFISSFLVVAAIIAQFGVHTRNRALDEISP